jgi:hypothetical protein
MALDPLSSILDFGKAVIERFIPDPKAKAEAIQKLAEMQQSGDLQAMAQQANINAIEAANPNIFIAGWRPAVGWVCAAGLAVILVIGPLLAWGSALAGKPIAAPVMPVEATMTLVTSMLGMASLRTYEKLKDKESNR